MVSSTQQTYRRRRMKLGTVGRANKRARLKAGTPAFPVHPEGYDASRPDAKKSR